MKNWFDLHWDSIPGDGAAAPVGAPTPSDWTDDDQLMRAWFLERQENIERGIYLDRSVQLLGRILSDGEISAGNQRRARHLLRAIRAARRGEREGTA